MNSNRRAKRHQSTPACARCNRLKQKCDRGTPRCSRCVDARAECMAISRATSAQVPRSPVQYLEQRLAELRQSKVNSGRSKAHGHGDSCILDSQSHAQVLELITLSMVDRLTPSLFSSGGKIQHYAKLFYPSERPPLKIPVRGIYHDVHRRTAGRAYAAQSSHFKARNIPIHVATRLFKNYKDEILPRFPCFLEEDLIDLFSRFYNTVGDDGSVDEMPGFVVPMVLAISSLTSNSHDFPKVAALSESLYSDAMRHAGLLKDSSISSLQCVLLLVQLGQLLPYTSNAWYMTGEAMRIAVGLGLHQELGTDIIPDAKQSELRRRIFWTTYQLDRTVGISAGCPVALSDEHITTQLPYGGGDIHSMPKGFSLQNTHSSKEVQFLLHTRVRSIQSQIHGIQFFDQHLPREAPSYEAWVRDTANLIENLVSQVTADGAAKSWLAAAAQQCQVLLHRPCSRNIAVSEPSLLASVTASMQLLTSYTSSLQAGGLVMAFELANSAFQAGMVLLYALRNHSVVLEQTAILGAAHESLNVLPKLLEKLAIRWPAVSDTAHYIRELVETCLRNPVGHDGTTYDINVLEELDCLVTQRRVHTLHHRNIPFPPHRSQGPQSDTASQASEGFLDDEEWWRAFIRDDFEMDEDTGFTPAPEPTPAMVPAEPAATSSVVTSLDTSMPMKTKPVSMSTEVDELLKALPSCSYCRDRRIKCYQQIPACRECQRTSRECVIFDPILEGNVPLRRLGLLIDSIREAESETQATNTIDAPKHSMWSGQVVLLPLTSGARQPTLKQTALFGPWSSLGLLRQSISQRAGFEIPRVICQANYFSARGLDTEVATNGALPPISTAIGLCQLFARTTNVFYPVLDQPSLDDVLSHCYSNGKKDFHDHSHGILYLVLAIASLVGKRSDPSLAAHAESYFIKATSAMSTTCDHSSRDANVLLLQRTLLICNYLLLKPGAGDIWRHLGFAIRHFLDLAHRPSMEEDKYHDTLCTLTRTLYSLESQVSIAFGRPSLLSIGDDLRQELTKTATDDPKDRIAIFSYLISFQMMQIHTALISWDTHSNRQATGGNLAQAESSDYRRGLDEWYVRWKEFVSSLPADESRANLLSWGQFNYCQGIFLLSLLRPMPGGTETSGAIVDAGLSLIQHQQLFSKPGAAAWQRKLPVAFPVTWTMSHAVLTAWLHICSANNLTVDEGNEMAVSLGRLTSLIMVLEADPDNLLTGMSLILKNLKPKVSGNGD